jgi:hypothetical protein
MGLLGPDSDPANQLQFEKDGKDMSKMTARFFLWIVRNRLPPGEQGF